MRKGAYIKLAGSWFEHPFPTNTFKIQTDKELSILRGLKKTKILYDPGRSDPLPSQEDHENGDTASGVSSNNIPVALEGVPLEHPEGQTLSKGLLHETGSVSGEPPPGSPEYEGVDMPAVEQEQVERRQTFERRRNSLIQAEKAYKQVVGMNKAIIGDLKNGYVKGIVRAEDLITQLDGILEGDGTIVSLMNLMGDNEVGSEFHYHSLNVAILSIAVGRELELPNEDVKSLGMGGLLHDIGYLSGLHQFTTRISSLTKNEIRDMRRHPENGRIMVDKGYGLDNACLEIIAEHHERLNGSGYPKGLKEEGIHRLTKIVAVVDAFEELSNNPDLEQSVTPYEALCTLYSKKKEEFAEIAVDVLVRTLGVFPPSSLVELSDGSIGVVCTINQEDRMRPQVMLYSPDLPRNEAIIMDLAHEDPSLTIKQSLRPGQVSETIRNYLTPRGMISYVATPSETSTLPPAP